MELKDLRLQIYEDYRFLIDSMELSNKRSKHIEGCIKCAYKLGARYELDVYKCVLAAWLHDYFRDKSKKEIVKIAKKYGVKLGKFEKKYPAILHGKVAVKYFVRSGYSIPNEVLSSIKYHTLSNKKVDDYGKLLFIVDAIEETRGYDGVGVLRDFVSCNNLEDSYREVLKRTISDLIKKNKEIPLVTIKAYNKSMEGFNDRF